ncbi:hypothetical protein [Paraconexibacter algicola]|uniref:Uncharacterized protein n=1 Tax=Paraconexibacter algicola TaxID=2133960 RepID=A0A2T4UJM8_9ACTN|nr:hypothetical protein [Paraconexibacter algicola]PTL59442.1 hypothetical protein C7Y72_07145 [Paraconexibacter algicola]
MVARRATSLSAAALTAVAVAAVPAAGQSEKPRPISESPLLWATVNVCDTADRPDTIGIRASMPGSGISAERMFMRFQVQFFSRTDNRWHNVGRGGDSGFLAVGSGRYLQRQSGRNFVIKAPTAGGYRLRGAVTFEWRQDGEVVRRARTRTTSGHGNTRGADPKGYSRASCIIR